MADKKMLTRQEKDWLLSDILHNFSIDDSLKKLDFENRLQFNRYLKTDPEFHQEIKDAEIDSCVFIENDMLNIHKKSKGDHKIARILLEAYSKCLVYRNPAKYSQRIDLNVNQNVSMRVAIEGANQRVVELFAPVIEASGVKLLK